MVIKLHCIVIDYRTPDDLEEFLYSWAEVASEIDSKLTIVQVTPRKQDFELVNLAANSYLSPFDISYKAWDDNVGFNIAANYSSSETTSPYLGIFNADVVLKPGVLSSCVETLEQNGNWAVVAPRQVDTLNHITCAGTFGTNTQPRMRGWMDFDKGQYSDIRDDCVHVSGSAMIWNRLWWDTLTRCPKYQAVAPGAKGALLPAQHFYGETWAMYHARNHGYQIGYLGTVCAIHKWHRASPRGQAPNVNEDQAYFRRACAYHGIACD